MRKPIPVLLFILFIPLFIGCNNDELTVILKQHGTLSAKVVDSNGSALEGATFFVSSGSGNYNLTEGVTDASGVISSLMLKEGEYECGASIKKGKLVYQEIRAVQVHADRETEIELNPLGNVGDITLYINTQYDDLDLTDFSIGLLDYYYDYYVIDIVKEALITKKIDETGKTILENLPVGEYYLFIYKEDGDWKRMYGDIMVQRKENLHYNVTINY